MHAYRTHTCGSLRSDDVGRRVRLSGWVNRRRDHGGLLFLDLRDHYGITQAVIEPDSPMFAEADRARSEWVVSVTGPVVARTPETVNRDMATGEVEVRIEEFQVLSSAQELPFPVFTEAEYPEEVRLKYRFLDLRREHLHRNITLRSNVIQSIRRRMIAGGFTEFQTPILTASSPEGARDFLVPSRLHPGKFYALPQAPQQVKQLVMIAGFDRYFQIAPCFRDEDARADRSPGEFYQLDLEMSFVTQEDVFAAVEALLAGLFEEFAPSRIRTPIPFPRISYDDTMRRFGTDKPDLRNPLEITDLTALFASSGFKAFAGKTVRAMRIPAGSKQSRTFFDRMEERAKGEGAAGLAWVLVEPGNTFKGPIAKFLTPDDTAAVLAQTGSQVEDAIIFLSDKDTAKICRILGGLRTYLGQTLNLIEENVFRFCWIVDFPMYEYDAEHEKIDFSHNPFSMPQGGLEALNTRDPLTIKAFQYDIVCNGYELSSGAIRNHHPEIMYRAFEIAGYERSEVDQRFRALINALKFGAPPHGGIAPGIDRIVMLLADEPNIREVIMFPMNQNAEDLMMNAPNTVRPEQLRDLHIRIVEPGKK